MTPSEVLAECSRRGVELSATPAGAVRWRCRGTLPEDLRQAIQENKIGLLALLVRLHDLVKAGSQFVIATHSPILLAYPEATIFALEADNVGPIEYEQTEHFQVTRRFLIDHAGMLEQLLR